MVYSLLWVRSQATAEGAIGCGVQSGSAVEKVWGIKKKNNSKEGLYEGL